MTGNRIFRRDTRAEDREKARCELKEAIVRDEITTYEGMLKRSEKMIAESPSAQQPTGNHSQGLLKVLAYTFEN